MRLREATLKWLDSQPGTRTANVERCVDLARGVRGEDDTSPEATETAKGSQPAPHRHRRHQLVREGYEKGSRVEIWACECGKEMA